MDRSSILTFSPFFSLSLSLSLSRSPFFRTGRERGREEKAATGLEGGGRTRWCFLRAAHPISREPLAVYRLHFRSLKSSRSRPGRCTAPPSSPFSFSCSCSFPSLPSSPGARGGGSPYPAPDGIFIIKKYYSWPEA